MLGTVFMLKQFIFHLPFLSCDKRTWQKLPCMRVTSLALMLHVLFLSEMVNLLYITFLNVLHWPQLNWSANQLFLWKQVVIAWRLYWRHHLNDNATLTFTCCGIGCLPVFSFPAPKHVNHYYVHRWSVFQYGLSCLLWYAFQYPLLCPETILM